MIRTGYLHFFDQNRFLHMEKQRFHREKGTFV
jgi:hypothetical protein